MTAIFLALILASPIVADEKGKKGEKREHDDEREKVQQHGNNNGNNNDNNNDNDNNNRDERRAIATPAPRVTIINSDVNRIESLLATAQNSSVTFTKPTLTQLANEANVLANRILVNAKRIDRSRLTPAAAELRSHVRQMREAAVRGDVAGVRAHANQALSFALRLDGLV